MNFLRNIAAGEYAWVEAQEATLKTLGAPVPEPIIRLRGLAKAVLEATPGLGEQADVEDLKKKNADLFARCNQAWLMVQAARDALQVGFDHAPPEMPVPTDPTASRTMTVNGVPTVTPALVPLRHWLALCPVGGDENRLRVILSEMQEGRWVYQTIGWDGAVNPTWVWTHPGEWRAAEWTPEADGLYKGMPHWKDIKADLDGRAAEKAQRKTGASRKAEPVVAAASIAASVGVPLPLEVSDSVPGATVAPGRRTRLRCRNPGPGMRVEPFEVEVVEEDAMAWVCNVGEAKGQRYPKSAWIELDGPQPAPGRTKVADWRPDDATMEAIATKAGTTIHIARLALIEWQLKKGTVEVTDPAAAFTAVLSRKVKGS